MTSRAEPSRAGPTGLLVSLGKTVEYLTFAKYLVILRRRRWPGVVNVFFSLFSRHKEGVPV